MSNFKQEIYKYKMFSHILKLFQNASSILSKTKFHCIVKYSHRVSMITCYINIISTTNCTLTNKKFSILFIKKTYK